MIKTEPCKQQRTPTPRFHKITAIFPPIEGKAFEQLVEDIRQHGLLVPIVTYRNQIIDGRHRLQACRKAGVEPVWQEWDGNGSLVSYVVGLNMHRRQLTTSQRAMVSTRIAPLIEAEAKQRQKAGQACDPSRKGRTDRLAGKAMGISSESVRAARHVITGGIDELNQAVVSGDVSVSDAASVSCRAPAVQRAALRSVADGKTRTLRKAVDKGQGNSRSFTSAGLRELASEFGAAGKEVAAIADQLDAIDLDEVVLSAPGWFGQLGQSIVRFGEHARRVIDLVDNDKALSGGPGR